MSASPPTAAAPSCGPWTSRAARVRHRSSPSTCCSRSPTETARARARRRGARARGGGPHRAGDRGRDRAGPRRRARGRRRAGVRRRRDAGAAARRQPGLRHRDEAGARAVAARGRRPRRAPDRHRAPAARPARHARRQRRAAPRPPRRAAVGGSRRCYRSRWHRGADSFRGAMPYDAPGHADQLTDELRTHWNETIARAYASQSDSLKSRFFTLDPATLEDGHRERRDQVAGRSRQAGLLRRGGQRAGAVGLGADRPPRRPARVLRVPDPHRARRDRRAAAQARRGHDRVSRVLGVHRDARPRARARDGDRGARRRADVGGALRRRRPAGRSASRSARSPSGMPARATATTAACASRACRRSRRAR